MVFPRSTIRSRPFFSPLLTSLRFCAMKRTYAVQAPSCVTQISVLTTVLKTQRMENKNQYNNYTLIFTLPLRKYVTNIGLTLLCYFQRKIVAVIDIDNLAISSCYENFKLLSLMSSEIDCLHCQGILKYFLHRVTINGLAGYSNIKFSPNMY